MKPTTWFGIIVLFIAATLLTVYLIPTGSIFGVIRGVLAFIFVAILPGYCLVTFLFQEGKLDLAEKAVLSVALSFSIAGISGLFLGLTSVGINFNSITQTLSVIVFVLAVLAFLRKAGYIRVPQRKITIKAPAQLSQ